MQVDKRVSDVFDYAYKIQLLLIKSLVVTVKSSTAPVLSEWYLCERGTPLLLRCPCLYPPQ
jgi:hypothetical protein